MQEMPGGSELRECSWLRAGECRPLTGPGTYVLVQGHFVFVQQGKLVVDHRDLGLGLGHATLKSFQKLQAGDEVRQGVRPAFESGHTHTLTLSS